MIKIFIAAAILSTSTISTSYAEQTTFVGKNTPVPFRGPLHYRLCQHVIKDLSARAGITSALQFRGGNRANESDMAWTITGVHLLTDTKFPTGSYDYLKAAHELKIKNYLNEIGTAESIIEDRGDRSGRIGSPADIEGRLQTLYQHGHPHWNPYGQAPHGISQFNWAEPHLATNSSLLKFVGVHNSSRDLGHGIRAIDFAHFVWDRGSHPAVGTGIFGYLTPARLLFRDPRDSNDLSMYAMNSAKIEIGEQEWISYDLDHIDPPTDPSENLEPTLEFLGYWTPREGYILNTPRDNIPNAVLSTHLEGEIPALQYGEMILKRTNFWKVTARQDPNEVFENGVVGYIADPILNSKAQAFRRTMRFTAGGFRVPDGFSASAFVVDQANFLNNLPGVEATVFSHQGFHRSDADALDRAVEQLHGSYATQIKNELAEYMKLLFQARDIRLLEGREEIGGFIADLAQNDPQINTWSGQALRDFIKIPAYRSELSFLVDPKSKFLDAHIEYAVGSSTFQEINKKLHRIVRIYLYFDNKQAMRIVWQYPID